MVGTLCNVLHFQLVWSRGGVVPKEPELNGTKPEPQSLKMLEPDKKYRIGTGPGKEPQHIYKVLGHHHGRSVAKVCAAQFAALRATAGVPFCCAR